MGFAGWVSTLAFIPRIADIKGRFWIVWVSIIIEMCAYIGLLFTHSIPVTMVMIFIIGVCTTGKSVVLYVYGSEFMPANKQTMYGALINMVDGSTPMWCSIGLALNPYTQPLMIYAICAHVVCISGVWFFPESFSYYYSVGKYD